MRTARRCGPTPAGILALWLAGVAAAFGQSNTAPVTERSLALGGDTTEGNSQTEQLTLGAKLNIEREKYAHRVEISGSYGRSEEEDEETGETRMDTTSQKFSLDAESRRMITSRNYVQMVASGLHNKTADIQYRLAVGPGVGRYFLKEGGNRLTGDVGFSYIEEKVPDDSPAGTLAYRLAGRWEQPLGEKAKLTVSGEYLPQTKDMTDFLFNGEIGVETAVTSVLGLRVSLQDKFDSQPSEDKEKRDLALSTALMVKL